MAVFRRTLLPLLISLWLVASGVASAFRAPLPCASRGCDMPCCQSQDREPKACCASADQAPIAVCCDSKTSECGSCGCIAASTTQPTAAGPAAPFELPTFEFAGLLERVTEFEVASRIESEPLSPTDARGPPGKPDVALPLLRAPPKA